RSFEGSSSYLVAQVVLGVAYMYVTINMAWPLTAWHRVALSFGLFLMITSWGGILQARAWAIPLEIARLLYMAASVLIVLDATGIAPWTGWLTVLVAGAAGISILWFS